MDSLTGALWVHTSGSLLFAACHWQNATSLSLGCAKRPDMWGKTPPNEHKPFYLSPIIFEIAWPAKLVLFWKLSENITYCCDSLLFVVLIRDKCNTERHKCQAYINLWNSCFPMLAKQIQSYNAFQCTAVNWRSGYSDYVLLNLSDKLNWNRNPVAQTNGECAGE